MVLLKVENMVGRRREGSKQDSAYIALANMFTHLFRKGQTTNTMQSFDILAKSLLDNNVIITYLQIPQSASSKGVSINRRPSHCNTML
jgi:hypothetical protein